MEEIIRIGRKQTNSEITINDIELVPTGRRSDFQITSEAQEYSTKSFPDGQHKVRPRTTSSIKIYTKYALPRRASRTGTGPMSQGRHVQ